MRLFCLVLHTHLPYVRRNGVWPSGEDHFHQAATESYLPILESLERLADESLDDCFTLGLSPMVSHQLSDEHMLDELGWFIGRYEPRALRNAVMYEGQHRDEIRALAGWYATWARARAETLDRVRARDGGLAQGFAGFSRSGTIEVLGGPMTHPLLAETDPALAKLQLSLGMDASRQVDATAGIWLPECHYRPGIEDLLQAQGVSHLVVDGPTMISSGGATASPRRLGDTDVVAFARDLDVTYRVWSPTGGYPSRAWYRDFYHYDVVGGFKNWRVTGINKPLERKRPYEPERAHTNAIADAEEMAAHVIAACKQAESVGDGVVVAAYDTELYGHWWFEGPIFLEHLVRTLKASDEVEMTTLNKARERVPAQPIQMREGSWGFRKDLRSWIAPETEWMRTTLKEVESDTVDLLSIAGSLDAPRQRACLQAVREAILLRSSDWPFLVLRGRNPDYAWERFHGHHENWKQMIDLARSHIPSDLVDAAVQDCFDRNNILPDLDLSEALAAIGSRET